MKRILVLFLIIILITSCTKANEKYIIEVEKKKNTELENNSSLINELESQLENKNGYITHLENELDNAIMQLTGMKEELQKEKNEISKLQNLNKEYEDEIQKIKKKEYRENFIIGFQDSSIIGKSESYSDTGFNNLIGFGERFIDEELSKGINNLNLKFSYEVDYENKCYNKTLINIIENNLEFENLRYYANTNYSFYSIDKKLGESYGRITTYERGDSFLVFDNPNLNGIFISGDYNHMPRKIDVLINNSENEELQKNEHSLDGIIEVGKTIIGNDKEIIITQLIECDINNDSALEKLVTFNNAIDNKEYILENWTTISTEDYYSISVVLDEKNNLLGYLFDIRDVKDSMLIGNFLSEIIYILDVDNDSDYEVITLVPGWEGLDYNIHNISLQNFKIESETFYDGM